MKNILLAALFLIVFKADANVQLPKFFSNNMVLQRNHTIPVWGWAAKNEKIIVSIHKQTKITKADNLGKWRIDLAEEQAGGPFILTIKATNTIIINNVLFGDVWICSGQSNMDMKIGGWGFVNNYKQEIANANYANIRHFEVQKAVASKPQTNVEGGQWEVCSPQTAANFSAVAYFFARKLNQDLNVPIGLIVTSWGGTNVETWTSKPAFESNDEFKQMISNMPNLDINELMKQKQENFNIKYKTIKENLKTDTLDIAKWKLIEYDDSKWTKINAPMLWEQQGLADFDGEICFRKTIELAKKDAGKEAFVELGTIDDDDETYLNGVKIGETKSYNKARKYHVDAGILKQGKNVIMVMVKDNTGGGGFYGDADNMKLTIADNQQTLAGVWLYKVKSMANPSLTFDPNSYPTLLFNGMLSPLIPYAIKGAVWYQGESNVSRAYQYRKAFPLLITDWRTHWKQGDFPFYFVQLTTFNENNGNSNKGSAWAEMRQSQALTLTLPNTGMAVTTDIGDPKDIHPANKQDVGLRLAQIALNKTYNKENVYTGPVFSSIKIDANKAILSFTNVGSGLKTTDKYGYVKGFEIAGADKKFKYANAKIEGNNIVLYQNEIEKPIAVRFSWADDASESNLFNKEGFPAAPFRTDDWPSVTESVKYEIAK